MASLTFVLSYPCVVQAEIGAMINICPGPPVSNWFSILHSSECCTLLPHAWSTLLKGEIIYHKYIEGCSDLHFEKGI